MKNWAGNHEYRAAAIHFPTSVDRVCELVARSVKVHAVGSRHSFYDIADAAGGDLVSLKYLDRVLSFDLDPGHPTVTVQAGITYAQLCPYLESEGFALPNMASLPHISVAGACATASHGSGDHLQSLAAAVSAFKFVDGDGNIVTVSRLRDGDEFEGMVVALGGLGVLTELTLDVIDSFEMQQHVYENLSLAQVRTGFGKITRSAYSVSLFTDWQKDRFNQIWLKSRCGVPHLELESLGATRAAEQRHPVQGSALGTSLEALTEPRKCTEQLGKPGASYHRLPHFRADEEPSSSGEELQTEYLLPREHAIEAFEMLFGLGDRFRSILQISEVRTIAEDRLWMSPFYKRPAVAIHFTWRKDLAAVEALLPEIETELERFQPRPHWGKLFQVSPARLQSLYPKLPDFRELLRRYDPRGKFRNDYLNRYIFQSPLTSCAGSMNGGSK